MSLKIVTQDFYINHSCGCCTDWGTSLFVDNKPIDQVFHDKSAALEFVLKSLGHEVDELDGIYEDDRGKGEEDSGYDDDDDYEGVEEGVPDSNSV